MANRETPAQIFPDSGLDYEQATRLQAGSEKLVYRILGRSSYLKSCFPVEPLDCPGGRLFWVGKGGRQGDRLLRTNLLVRPDCDPLDPPRETKWGSRTMGEAMIGFAPKQIPASTGIQYTKT